MPDPSSAEFFEQKYQHAADPWSFATSTYELNRYDLIVRALSDRRYGRAFEPGCSVGVLTERLSPLCASVDASDFSSTAVAAAVARCKHLPNVTVRCSTLSVSTPWHDYNLILLCEIGYYFTPVEWQALVTKMVKEMQPGAVLLASHWLGKSLDHKQSGNAVHATLRQSDLIRTLIEKHEGFLLERWTKKR